MKFLRRKQKAEFRHLGYRKEIMPIAEKAMADFLLRISINSSYVLLGIYDIASEGFYKSNIVDFFDQIPEHLSFSNEFSIYLKPYVSDKFKDIVYSDRHELIIGSFYKYYSIRLPVLVHHGRFWDWPQNKGVSEDDLKKITPYSFAQFKKYFPTAAEKLMGNSPEDQNSIFFLYAVGKEIACEYKLENDEMIKFLYDDDPIWQDIMIYLPELRDNWNIFSFFSMVYRKYFRIFWDSYYSDYMDTMRHWSMFGGAFEGDERNLHEAFWDDLEKQLDRHEFIFRTAEPY